jgi:heterotetrameric sarcosine oxidase delta subunit
MMRIPCPHCGLRDEDEFVYGGDATLERPAEPESLDDAQWTAYLYLRDNPRGAHREHWFHRYGCRRWTVVERDTLTHAIAATHASRR